ncbi:unnamed protein product [Meganyctiphanes norvegica]|uniref:Uncharacterized protein n=1 Tax=Meganyctiphanes norvegica TaxID=48144 RepID=A0AAV2RMV3_MEGNR
MKGIPRASLLVLALVALSQAWSEYRPRETRGQDYSPKDTYGQDYSPRDTRGQDYSPEDTYGQDYSPRDTRGQDYIPEDTYGQDYSPRDTRGQDYSPEDTSEQEDSSEDTLGQDPQLDVLQVLRGFNADSNDYPEVRSFNADSNDYPEVRSFNADSNDYPEVRSFNADSNDYPEVQSFNADSNEYPEVRSFNADSNDYPEVGSFNADSNEYPESRGFNAEYNDYPEVDNEILSSAVDKSSTYVTFRPLPARGGNYPISRSVAEDILQIMKGITGSGITYNIKMNGKEKIRCTSSFPVKGKHNPYSSSQAFIKMKVTVKSTCYYPGSKDSNIAMTEASVTFTMSPEAHFIITGVEVEPETEDDFSGSRGSPNNPMDTILKYSQQLVKTYLQKSVRKVFSSLKRNA